MSEQSEPEGPQGRYKLLRVYTLDQSFELVDNEKEDLPEDEHDLELGWSWRIPDIASVAEAAGEAEELPSFTFEVAVLLQTKGPQSEPIQAEATLIGTFQYEGGEPSIPFKGFVSVNAVAMLFPYGRQILSDLSGRGPYDAVILPPVNVAAVMQDFDYSESRGADQLLEYPELAAKLGLPE